MCLWIIGHTYCIYMKMYAPRADGYIYICLLLSLWSYFLSVLSTLWCYSTISRWDICLKMQPWGKFGKLLPVLTIRLRTPCLVFRARCTKPAFARICSTLAKRGDQITTNCSGSAAMTVPWSAGTVASKTETKQLKFHYYKDLTLRILRRSFTVGDSDGMAMYSEPRPVSNLSQTFRFLTLESKGGLGRHGLNVLRLMSVSVAWLALTVVDIQDSMEAY